jgi:hypothetical protein
MQSKLQTDPKRKRKLVFLVLLGADEAMLPSRLATHKVPCADHLALLSLLSGVHTALCVQKKRVWLGGGAVMGVVWFVRRFFRALRAPLNRPLEPLLWVAAMVSAKDVWVSRCCFWFFWFGIAFVAHTRTHNFVSCVVCHHAPPPLLHAYAHAHAHPSGKPPFIACVTRRQRQGKKTFWRAF